MATVKFDNGTTVNFDGNPSPADIEHVAQQLGITPGSNQSSAPVAPAAPKLDANGVPIAGPDVGGFVRSLFPNKNLGDLIGTGIAKLTASPEERKYIHLDPSTSVKGVLGDVGNDALNIGSLLLAPETGGGSLAARSAISGGINAGMSLSNSASQGRSLTDSGTIKDAAGAGIFGALLPGLGKVFTEMADAGRNLSVSPQMQTLLQEADTKPEDVKKYIDAAKAHGTDIRAKTPYGLMDEQIETAAQKVQGQLKAAKNAVGDALKADGSKMLGTNPATGDTLPDEMLSSFNKSVEDRLGHTIETPRGASLKINGQTVTELSDAEPELKQLEGRGVKLSSADEKRIMDVHAQLEKLAENPTVRMATDVKNNIYNMVDYSSMDKYGVNHDPLEGILKETAYNINEGIRATSPAVAQANDTASKLHDIDELIGAKAGKNLQRGDLVMRRVMSGDKTAESQQFFDLIKQATGIDLTKEAALAHFATENFGDASAKTRMAQILGNEGSVFEATKRSLIRPLKAGTKKLISPDTEEFALNLAKGSKFAPAHLGGALPSLDQLANDPQSRNLIRTYISNINAKNPVVGRALLQGGINFTRNVTK